MPHTITTDLINTADSYKYSHGPQYPRTMSYSYEYMEARGGPYDAIVFSGLHPYLEYLASGISIASVQRANDMATAHGIPFDFPGWMYIADDLDGKLPINIKALPEGTIAPYGVPLLTVESTDPRVPWIAGWVETLLMKVWYPTAVATKARAVRNILLKYVSPAEADFMYHLFGDRAATSVESAAIGSLGHILLFNGTDNFNSLFVIQDWGYTVDMPAFSVFATEHSTTTSHGQSGEFDFVLTTVNDNLHRPILSFVGDSYDIFEFTRYVTSGELRTIIDQPDTPTFVIRPDSGNPLEVLPGLYDILLENEILLTKVDGMYKFTNYRILWGDGISPNTIQAILEQAVSLGIHPSNLIFGSGGDIMQNVTRDTNSFAMKCSYIELSDGTSRDVYKQPKTDLSKQSKRGKVTTHINLNTRELTLATVGDPGTCALVSHFHNGEILIQPDLDLSRSRARS